MTGSGCGSFWYHSTRAGELPGALGWKGNRPLKPASYQRIGSMSRRVGFTKALARASGVPAEIPQTVTTDLRDIQAL